MNPTRNPISFDYPRNRSECRKNRKLFCSRAKRLQRQPLFKGLQKGESK